MDKVKGKVAGKDFEYTQTTVKDLKELLSKFPDDAIVETGVINLDFTPVSLFIHSLNPKKPLCHLLIDDIEGLTAIKPANGLTVGQTSDKLFVASYSNTSATANSEAEAIKELRGKAKLETF